MERQESASEPGDAPQDAPADADDAPAADVAHSRLTEACMAIARRLRLAHRDAPSAPSSYRMGLLPVTQGVSARPVGLALGSALAQLSGDNVAVVDGYQYREPFAPGVPHEIAEFSAQAVHEHVVRFVAQQEGAPGSAGPALERLFEQLAQGGYVYWLVDLTGLQKMGEHLGVARWFDEILLIARAGKTREEDLLSLAQELKSSEQMGRVGVLLTGDETKWGRSRSFGR